MLAGCWSAPAAARSGRRGQRRGEALQAFEAGVELLAEIEVIDVLLGRQDVNRRAGRELQIVLHARMDVLRLDAVVLRQRLHQELVGGVVADAVHRRQQLDLRAERLTAVHQPAHRLRRECVQAVDPLRLRMLGIHRDAEPDVLHLDVLEPPGSNPLMWSSCRCVATIRSRRFLPGADPAGSSLFEVLDGLLQQLVAALLAAIDQDVEPVLRTGNAHVDAVAAADVVGADQQLISHCRSPVSDALASVVVFGEVQVRRQLEPDQLSVVFRRHRRHERRHQSLRRPQQRADAAGGDLGGDVAPAAPPAGPRLRSPPPSTALPSCRRAPACRHTAASRASSSRTARCRSR